MKQIKLTIEKVEFRNNEPYYLINDKFAVYSDGVVYNTKNGDEDIPVEILEFVNFLHK